MNHAIAVLMTCHNRKAKTLRCLDLVFSQSLPFDCGIDVFLVDDGSSDGTAEGVRAAFPRANIIMADGSLFWSGGMHLAWQHAAQRDYEFYLWMNDDTYLRPQCISTLLRTHEQYAAAGCEACVVVASCYDPETGKHSYGGEMVRDGHPGRATAVLPDLHVPKVCETFNGNCVLVPRAAFRVLGFMRRFRHSISDTDYGLYATRRGVPVVIAPGYLAECMLNPIFDCPHSAWQNPALPRAERWRILVGRQGLPPTDWWKFLWAHAGIRAIWYWPGPYLRVLAGL
jgi:GT2 family glycosyltransferase